MPSHYEMLAGQMAQQPSIEEQFLASTDRLQQTKLAIAEMHKRINEDSFVSQMATYKALVDAGAYNAANKFFTENIQPIAQTDDGQPVFPSVDLSAAGPEFHKQLSNLWSKGLDKTGRMQNRQALTEAARRLAQEFPRAQAPRTGPAGNIPKGSGVVQEYTGNRLTKEQRVQGPTTELNDDVDDAYSGDEPEDEVYPGVTNQMVTERADKLMRKAGIQPGSLATPDDEFEYQLNAKMELGREAVAQQYNTTPELVDDYVWTMMRVDEADPESLIYALATGQHKLGELPTKLNPELLKPYFDRGMSEQQIRQLFRDKYAGTSQSAD